MSRWVGERAGVGSSIEVGRKDAKNVRPEGRERTPCDDGPLWVVDVCVIDGNDPVRSGKGYKG